MPYESIHWTKAVTLLLLLLLAPKGLPADIYSWVDANGIRHFSNTDTDGSGEAVSSPEFSLSPEEAERLEREAVEKTSRDKDLSANPKRLEEAQPSQKGGNPITQQDKERSEAREALQAKCKKAKERLSTLRFTSLNKYENAEVERFAMEWTSRHLRNESSNGKTNWKQTRDEDVQNYKKFKYEQELKQAEKEVDEYCKN